MLGLQHGLFFNPDSTTRRRIQQSSMNHCESSTNHTFRPHFLRVHLVRNLVPTPNSFLITTPLTAGRFAPLEGITIKKGSTLADKNSNNLQKPLPPSPGSAIAPAHVLIRDPADLPVPDGHSTVGGSTTRTRGMPAWKPRQLGHLNRTK